MNSNNVPKFLIDYLKSQNKKLVTIPKRDEILLFLNSFLPFTGQFDNLFCNWFLQESSQLIINSIFLYEDGFFDCAFYSLRQANEVIDSMLYHSVTEKKILKQWSMKGYFPFDSTIKKNLENLSVEFREIKELIPEFFSEHSRLNRNVNKIIHKQGFDTFYIYRNGFEEKNQQYLISETELFFQFLIHTIGFVSVLFIILEPISLAFADSNVDSKIPLNLLTDPIDLNFFDEFLGNYKIIDKIMGSRYYLSFIESFADNEPMLPSVYSVIREECWDLDALEEIEKQKHLLNTYQQFMHDILKNGISISRFLYHGGVTWYFTSIKSNFDRRSYGGPEFQQYLRSEKKFNQ
jgi:hypothetical protein